MKRDTEITIKIKEKRTNDNGVLSINQTVELECLNCGASYEWYNDSTIVNTKEALKDAISEYIDNNFTCDECKKGDNE